MIDMLASIDEVLFGGGPYKYITQTSCIGPIGRVADLVLWMLDRLPPFTRYLSFLYLNNGKQWLKLAAIRRQLLPKNCPNLGLLL
jgi:hypothetical protein